jgi:hypothetical protein
VVDGERQGEMVGVECPSRSEERIPLIRKDSDWITSIRLEFRRQASNGGADLPWGQGETPIEEILAQFPASIELEYENPGGSGAVVETSKCVQFCKNATGVVYVI